MGTPDFAVPALRAVARRCDVAAVVTQPDRGAGRGLRSSTSAIAQAAEILGLTVLKPADANDDATAEALREADADLFAVVAFGGILSAELLAIPRLGSINLHGSLLPEYRGASPVQRALWDGLPGTGVTTLWMDEGIDTGDMIFQQWAPIEPTDDAATLAARLAELGAPLLAESLVQAHAGKAPRIAQSEDSGSYARKLKKAHGIVDWSLDAVSVWNRQRAVTPWPGAITSYAGRRLRLHAAEPHHVLAQQHTPGTVLHVGKKAVMVACGSGALTLHQVQPESRGVMNAGEWARGARIERGHMLVAPPEAAT